MISYEQQESINNTIIKQTYLFFFSLQQSFPQF